MIGYVVAAIAIIGIGYYIYRVTKKEKDSSSGPTVVPPIKEPPNKRTSEP